MFCFRYLHFFLSLFNFREWKSKTILEDNKADDTVTFYMKDVFIFVPAKSGGLTGDEFVITLHPFLTGLIYAVKRDREPMLPIVEGALDPLLNNPKDPFFHGRAMDLMFDGITINCESEDFSPKAVCSALETEAKSLIKLDDHHYKFSIFGGVSHLKYNFFHICMFFYNIFLFFLSREMELKLINSRCIEA